MPKTVGRGKRPQLTIVYLDDQRWLLPLADRLLSEGGYCCRGYLDPLAVLELLKNGTERVDLVLTDQHMSGMTGIAFTRLAKALRPDLPIVMISGHLSDDLREAATAAGVSAFILKPAFSTELVKVVRELLPTPPQSLRRPHRARGEHKSRPQK